MRNACTIPRHSARRLAVRVSPDRMAVNSPERRNRPDVAAARALQTGSRRGAMETSDLLLIGCALVSALEPGPDALSPRLRQTLACLLEGDAEKQVAARLGLSPTTTHQYVTALYRHFGVRSRAQLLALVIKRLTRGLDIRRRPPATDWGISPTTRWSPHPSTRPN